MTRRNLRVVRCGIRAFGLARQVTRLVACLPIGAVPIDPERDSGGTGLAHRSDNGRRRCRSAGPGRNRRVQRRMSGGMCGGRAVEEVRSGGRVDGHRRWPGLVGTPRRRPRRPPRRRRSGSAVLLARPCVPEHRGPNWRWHATDRRFSDNGRVRNDRGHWDHLVRQWDRHDHRWEKRWVHLRYDDRYCQQREPARSRLPLTLPLPGDPQFRRCRRRGHLEHGVSGRSASPLQLRSCPSAASMPVPPGAARRRARRRCAR